MLRRAYIPAGAIIATSVIVAAFASPASAHVGEPEPVRDARWVAMGDSFQSGVGAGDYHGDSGDCRRSPWSHVEILHEEGAFPGDLDFVACSGARIEHLYTGHHGEQPQLDALGADSGDISHVSVGIGGNDLDFADNLRDCILYGWPWSSCESRFDDNVADSFYELLEQDAEGLNAFQRLYTDIRGAADREDTTILALTYPKFFPPDGGSDWSSIPLQPRCQGIRVSDQLWINNWIQRLNNAIIDSAHSVGAVPVDLYAASDGHELCNPEDRESHLHGLRLSSGAFHPTRFGYDRNTEVLRPHLSEPVPVPQPRATHVAGPPEPPEADARLTQDGDTIAVDASDSEEGGGAIETYLWEFDDGELVDGAEAIHTYDEPGTYYVTLSVIDANEEMGFSAPRRVVVE